MVKNFKDIAVTVQYHGVPLHELCPENAHAPKDQLACYECGRKCAGLAGLEARLRLAHDIGSRRNTACLLNQ
eukprot:2408146-Amphidinium_carterae.1